MLIPCHADILCDIISFITGISIADTISYVYIEVTAIICVTKNQYYIRTKRLPLNRKFLNLLLSLECNYTSIPQQSSEYLSSQECCFRFLTVVWLLGALALQCFDPSMFWPFSLFTRKPLSAQHTSVWELDMKSFMAFCYDLCKVW